jgi:hypothetical protein
MKLFYPNPFPRSTPISKNFLEFGAPSLLLLQYSGKLHRSQKPIRLCVDTIRIDSIHPNASRLSSEEPWDHAIYWLPWLVPLIGIKRDRDRDPNDRRDPWISATPASCESEACPNQVPAGLRICRFPDRLSTPASLISGKWLKSALLPSKSSLPYKGLSGRVERALGIEPATFGLGSQIPGPSPHPQSFNSPATMLDTSSSLPVSES